MFGSGRRKLVDNAAMKDANDVILLWPQSSLTAQFRRSAVHIHAKFWRFWGTWTP